MISSRLPSFAGGLAAVLLAGLAAPAPAATVDPAELSEHISVLASDRFEGRGPATPGEDKTVAYISRQFKNIGLVPAGDDGGWTQAVPLRRFETPGPISIGFTVHGKAMPLTELQDIVVHSLVPSGAAATGQAATGPVVVRDAPLVFIGFGVNAPERGWDDFKGYDLKGKIAVVLINDPDFEMDPKDPLYGRFDGKAMTLYGRWTYKYAEAARRGALGMLIVHETAPAAYGWATVKNSNSAPQFDIVRANPGAEHPFVEGWIQRDTAVALFKAAGLDFEAEKAKAHSLAFKPIALPAATFSTEFFVNYSTIVSHNVAGKIVGTRRPDEAVLISAHWDHLGVGLPDAKGDTIYNGAVDNASGVAGVLELARVFQTDPAPDRSLWFIALTAEEKGLLGSEYYAAHPLTPLATTVAMLNLDVLNIAGPSKDLATRGKGDADLDGLVARFLTAQGRSFTHDQHPEEGSFYRADHFSLAKVGVPAITIKAGLDLVTGGVAAGQAAHEDYTAHRYHQPADEWREDWDLSGAAQDLEVYHALGRTLANSDAWPGWPAGSEFKAARDATAAQRK